jgi:hypothetical protein
MDYCVMYDAQYQHSNIPYWEPVRQTLYVPGQAFFCKKSLLLEFPLDNELVWGQSEDVKWSLQLIQKLHAQGRFKYKLNAQTACLALKKHM